MKPKPLVLYHAGCWDGFCAAWIARKALGDIEAVPVQYGTEPPDVTGRVLYILDFCYPRDVMDRLLTSARRTIVLDHHKTAADALDGFHQPETGMDVIFDMDKSGGRLAWLWFWDHHFSHSTQTPGARYSEIAYTAGGVTVSRNHAPWLVDYTEDRDLWRHALPHSEEINAALRSYPLDFDLWDRFGAVRDVVNGTFLVQEGTAIRRRERQIIDSHVRNARTLNFSVMTELIDAEGPYVVPIVNATVLFSEIAGELAEGHPFAACYFDRQDGKRQWSLRSRDGGVDVAEIAKARGGGGHRNAAGFEQAIP